MKQESTDPIEWYAGYFFGVPLTIVSPLLQLPFLILPWAIAGWLLTKLPYALNWLITHNLF
jgi:hypothetical protein